MLLPLPMSAAVHGGQNSRHGEEIGEWGEFKKRHSLYQDWGLGNDQPGISCIRVNPCLILAWWDLVNNSKGTAEISVTKQCRHVICFTTILLSNRTSGPSYRRNPNTNLFHMA